VQRSDDPGYAIRVGLLVVVGFMSWPVWLAVVAGQRSFTWAVALSALVPLLLSVLPLAVALHAGAHIHRGLVALEHRLHVDALLHDRLHLHG
jgi:hypothetical protein